MIYTLGNPQNQMGNLFPLLNISGLQAEEMADKMFLIRELE